MQVKDSYDAIVIGAGVSGLLSALALSKEGKNVLLLEKSDLMGGNCRTYAVGRYRIDTGPHAITSVGNGPLQALMDKYCDRQPSYVRIGEYYARDGKKLQPIPITIKQLAEFNILPRKDRMLFFKAMADALTTSSLPLRKNKLELSVYDYIKDYGFSPKGLRFIDAIFLFLSGKSMKETPSWRMLGGSGYLDEERSKDQKSKKNIEKIKKLAMGGYDNHGYPIGGIQSITDCIVGSFPKDAVDVHKNEQVIRIETAGGKVCGVITEKGRYKSDLVVYCGFVKDLPSLIDNLDKSYSKSLRKLQQARSMTLWLGLKEKMETLSYVGSEVCFDTNAPFWAIPTSNYDPSLAPKGKQLVGFLTAIREDSDQKQLNNLRKSVFKAIPGIKSKVELEHVQVTIPEKAAVTVGVKFPSPHSPIHGLFLAGTDTDSRSMGLTRASYSVVEALKFMREDGYLR